MSEPIKGELQIRVNPFGAKVLIRPVPDDHKGNVATCLNETRSLAQREAYAEALVRRYNSQPDLYKALVLLTRLLCHPGSSVEAKDIEQAKKAIEKARIKINWGI